MESENIYNAGLEGVTFLSAGQRLLGGLYKAEGASPRPTAILIHGLPGIEKHLDIAYKLRDEGWNCLYFHFRGSWGSSGSFSMFQLEEDTKAALDWVAEQDCADKTRIVLIGTSTGSYPAFHLGKKDKRVAGIIAISPVIIPADFKFPEEMAEQFAQMLHGISGSELISEWRGLRSLETQIAGYLPRPLCIIAAGADPIFPSAAYEGVLSKYPEIVFIEKEDADHSFSKSRTWLVKNTVKWLKKTFHE